jgi:hypothetical protein
MPAEPLTLVLRGDDSDCAIVAIAGYTGQSYADVMREVLRHDPTGGATGLSNRTIRKVLTGLGESVRWTSKVDFDGHYGILIVENAKEGHAVILKRGQVVETASAWYGVWDVEDYLKAGAYEVEGIFLARD